MTVERTEERLFRLRGSTTRPVEAGFEERIDGRISDVRVLRSTDVYVHPNDKLHIVHTDRTGRMPVPFGDNVVEVGLSDNGMTIHLHEILEGPGIRRAVGRRSWTGRRVSYGWRPSETLWRAPGYEEQLLRDRS